MSSERLVLGFLMRSTVEDEPLLHAVAQTLAVPSEDVTRLDIEAPADAAVLVEVTRRAAGFRTDVTLYIDTNRAPKAAGRTSLDVASLIAEHHPDEILVSAPADEPTLGEAAYEWILIRPDGKRFIASELPPGEDSDIIDIDRAGLRSV